MAVYFIQRLDNSRQIKIGMSANVQRRYEQLSRESDTPLFLLGWLEDGREWLLHQEFAEYRAEGEWFWPAPVVVDFIRRHVRDGVPVPWDDMISRAEGRGQVVPLRSHFTRTVHYEDFLPDFSDLSRFDVAALVANTALVARDSGHAVIVRHARVQGEQGILIFIPGFELQNGDLRLVATEQTEAPAPQPVAAD